MALVFDRQVDVSRLSASAAIDAIARALEQVTASDLVEVLADDPRVAGALSEWARWNGVRLLESSRFGGVFRLVFRTPD